MKTEQRIIIEAGKIGKRYFKDLWSYRELFYFFAWRDILVRYKQTIFGVLWAILRPLLTMIVFSVIFGKFAKLPSNGVPYPILVYTAMLPWQFFSQSLQECSNSLITSQSMVSKIYFPKIIMPISAVIVALVDFLISFAIMIGLMVYYHFQPQWTVIWLPLFMLLAFFSATGPGLYMAALNVKYRDFRYIVPFITQFGLYISPVGFSSNVVPAKWRLIYSLNPMVGVIDGFRWCILGGGNVFYMPGLFFSLAVTIFFVIFGIHYFRKTERRFADII
jgi:lipopolysaccharide transport system permease protein